ncbi:hypothetical protein P152DRAFT_342635 [Eremomyces bilateralis CBS 781.70]|uniref:Uncharacterized protein n=1 Tax=Eremomyces bilateralis CBS 781.70 TaxID=1392243 RepID=A0A6G1G3C0_9PEZI|nr:uncharacterized protein P152DRAFT_342635 [Eremomyces bilateralis CBS 781.70]KAF1812554.1 hypothetical protein P152DRAFT_342635 [Eremomyces bilateralis CBS 781.70]
MSARSITSSHHSSTLGKVSPGSIAPTRHSSRRSHSSESNHSARSDTTETPTQLSLSRSLIATRSSRGRGDAISTESSNASPPLSQSPSFRLTRKRAAEEFERTVESKPVEVDEMDMEEISPTHTRASSGDSGGGQAGLHVCLCQPDPKIPRPRNGESNICHVCSQ